MGSHKILTPDEYGSAISDFSSLRTGEGEIHEGLADFLNSEPSSENGGSFLNTKLESSSEETFLTLYELYPDHSAGSEAKGCRMKPQVFKTPNEFLELPPIPEEDTRAQLFFLRGYPSPRWLKAIGSKYILEPDFLAKHLDFLNPNVSEDMPVVGLPTSLAHVIQLCITTIGSRNCEKRTYKQDEIDTIRKKDETDMTIYFSKLSKGLFNTGNAIVRRFSTLDETFFTIEQKVSIHIQNQGKRWVAFVWLDSGNNLDHSIQGPWSHDPGQIRLHPIITYNPMDALNPSLLENTKSRLQEHSKWSKQPQTAALIPIGYGSKLRLEKLDRGVMYVLYEIFAMSAHSESRFLVQVDLTLRRTLGQVNEDRFDGFTDLTFMRRLLYRHIQQIQTAMTALKNFRSLDSSDHRGSNENKASNTEAKAGTTTMWVLQDFNSNLEYAMTLDKQCQEGIAVLMSSASIAESRKAMALQERIGKLTMLAFLYVPLSFTTSFFGMNFKELNQQVISIWIWFVMAAPVIAITQIAYFCTLKQLTAPFRRLRG